MGGKLLDQLPSLYAHTGSQEAGELFVCTTS